jgi:hypothetical protein
MRRLVDYRSRPPAARVPAFVEDTTAPAVLSSASVATPAAGTAFLAPAAGPLLSNASQKQMGRVPGQHWARNQAKRRQKKTRKLRWMNQQPLGADNYKATNAGEKEKVAGLAPVLDETARDDASAIVKDADGSDDWFSANESVVDPDVEDDDDGSDDLQIIC